MPLLEPDCDPYVPNPKLDPDGVLTGLMSRPSPECVEKQIPDQQLPYGFLPTSQPQRMEPEPLTGFEAFLNSLPDWPIFQQETIGAIVIAGALLLWVRRVERTPKRNQRAGTPRA